MTTIEPAHAGKVVIVDSSEVVRRILTDHIRSDGYQVIAFESGERFLEWFGSEPCDALLLDSRMPGLSGLKILQRVRARLDRTEFPILFVTAESESHHVVAALTQGANDFLIKPIDFDVLSARLGVQVALKRSQEQLRESMAAQRKIRAQLEASAQSALTELNLAAELQRRIYQPTEPPPFLRMSSYFRPSSHVSGDILYGRPTPDGSFLCFLGDATGHGVAAALITMLVIALLETVERTTTSPKQILQRLNQQLAHFELNGRFVSSIAIRISPAGVLTAANAGHPAGILLRNSPAASRLIESSGSPLGWFENMDYGEIELQIAPGDQVLLITDGLSEWTDRNGVQFGHDRVLHLAQAIHQQKPDGLLEQLLAAVTAHSQGTVPQDDITLVALGYNP